MSLAAFNVESVLSVTSRMSVSQTLEAEGLKNKQALMAILVRLSRSAPALFIAGLSSPGINQSGPHPCS